MPAFYSPSPLPLKSDDLDQEDIKAESPQQQQQQAVKDDAIHSGQDEHSDDDQTIQIESHVQNAEDVVSHGTLATTTTTTTTPANSSARRLKLSEIAGGRDTTESTEYDYDGPTSPSYWGKNSFDDLTDEQFQKALGYPRELREPTVDDDDAEQRLTHSPPPQPIRASKSRQGSLRTTKPKSRIRSYYKRKADGLIDAHTRQVWRMQVAHDDEVRQLRAGWAAEKQSLSSSYRGMLEQLREAFVAHSESTHAAIERLEGKVSDLAESSSRGELQSQSRRRGSKRSHDGELVGGHGDLEDSRPMSGVDCTPEQTQFDGLARPEIWPSSTIIVRDPAESTSYVDPKKRRRRGSLVYTATDDE